VRNFAGWEGFDGWARNAMFKILGEVRVCVRESACVCLRACVRACVRACMRV
jgi:hypothetical protein